MVQSALRGAPEAVRRYWSTPERGWLPVAAAAAVLLLALGAPPIAAAAEPGAEPAEGRVTVAEDSQRTASLAFGSGWERRAGAAAAGAPAVFAHGAVELRVTALAPPGSAEPEDLWDGLRDQLRTADRSMRLGYPSPVRSRSGADGLAGRLRSTAETGQASVYTAPGGGFAVAMVLTAGRGTGRSETDAAAVVPRSIAFTSKDAAAEDEQDAGAPLGSGAAVPAAAEPPGPCSDTWRALLRGLGRAALDGAAGAAVQALPAPARAAASCSPQHSPGGPGGDTPAGVPAALQTQVREAAQ